MPEKIVHWADQIANEVKERVENDEVLKKTARKLGYIVLDEKTPSGVIHIGSGRGWVIHDAIAKAMRDAGMKGRFILSSDDIDPMDKLPAYLDKKFQKYMGMPFRNIPSPVEGYDSYADYYFMQCVEKFEEWGINAEIESTGKLYESGKFNAEIKEILDNSERVKTIFERIYGKPYDKLPFNAICEKCGRIGTTLASKWDRKNEVVSYKCEENAVEWAKGCGHEGDISPYNGNGKLPWKVEWAAKWRSLGVVCELGGKDHFTKKGSREVSVAISNEVLDYPPPYPSTRSSIGQGYEFFTISGKKMSTSKGQGVGFAEISNILPPRILRYLLVRTRIHAVVDFDPYRANDLILLFDRFDATERIYFGKEKLENETDLENQKRIYELSHIKELPEKMPVQIPLSLAGMVIQVGFNEEGAIKILQDTGHLPKDLSGIDQHYVMERLHDARNWIEHFATDDYKFILQKELPAGLKLSEDVKSALGEIPKLLKESKDEKELHNKFYELCQEHNIEVKDFFKGAYNILLNRDKGPRLAAFLMAVGHRRVSELFGKI
ncbi:MAG TPA: lysine--tRNA ligase [Candidatus Nanoarchaeia archaeon]|nr:lysine--tRNA ligase [Candidatus Nanoarchaeia archaeon]